MKLPLTVLVLVLAAAAFAPAASAHVVMVTAAIPVARASSDADLQQAVADVLDDAITRTVAFAPTQVTLQDVRQVGDQIYLILLILDADGEQLPWRP
jgi:hypothetical protein